MLAIAALIDFFCLLVFVAVLTSWIRLPPENPIARFLNVAVEPVLGPARRLLPSVGGLDLTPMLVIMALQAVKRALVSGAI